VVTLKDAKGQEKSYKIAGDWTPHASKVVDGTMIVSRQAPIAQALLGKKVGYATRFGTIGSIS
jgi:transcription elongation GreA/GreB family factor